MRRTYWHLRGAGRVPDDYEVVTSRLLYYPAAGAAVHTPARAWHLAQQSGSPVQGDHLFWDRFADPRRTTYSSYVALQRDREVFLGGLLEQAGSAELPRTWLALCDRLLAPLRYPCHALQMLAAQIGHLAPAGRIVVAAMFQAGDELRRVHRLAHRLAQLRHRHPALGATSQETWERDPVWQPLRRLVEELLATYDWARCLAGTALVLKPAFDRLFLHQLGQRAADSGDLASAGMLAALAEDGDWHRAWSAALVRHACSGGAENRAIFASWRADWEQRAVPAVTALAPVLAPAGRRDRAGAEAVLAAVRSAWAAQAVAAGLDEGDEVAS